MVQVIDDPYAGNIFGRIGKGIGKGLSEQLPKEIQRKRLSSGLRDLAESGETNPIAQLADLYNVPGMTPELAREALPYIRQQGAIKEAQRNQQKVSGQPANLQQSQASPQQGMQPEGDHAGHRLIGTPEAIRERAAIRAAESPLQFPTLDSAIQFEEGRVQTQEKQLGQIDNSFQQALQTKLQKGGSETFGDVLGDLQNTFRNKAYDDVLTGKMTPTEAANKYSKQALDFAKARQNLKTVGGLSKFTTSPSKNVDNLKAIREEYKKLGQLESFADDLVAYEGLSVPYANYLAHPINGNKEVNNYLKGLKRERLKIFSGAQEREIASNVAKRMNFNDSPQAIALQLQDQGFDPNTFLQQLRKEISAGNVPQLTERQAREMQKVGSFRPTLGDMYLFSIFGLDPLMEEK